MIRFQNQNKIAIFALTIHFLLFTMLYLHHISIRIGKNHSKGKPFVINRIAKTSSIGRDEGTRILKEVYIATIETDSTDGRGIVFIQKSRKSSVIKPIEWYRKEWF